FQTGKYWEGHWKSGGFTEGMTTFEPPPEGQDFGGVRVLANGDRVAHGNGDLGLQIGRVTLEPIKNFIHDCETEQTPWMVWYAPYLPHQPHDSPQRFYDLASARPGVEAHEVPYFASIAQFDETVGELIRLVESHSDMGNTIIVFVSDNGWSPDIVPQKGREEEFRPTKRSKRAPFDAGVRSPILIRWDARVSPAIHEELVSSIDIVATLVNAVGLNHGEFPGRDLLGVLDQDRAVFGAIYPGDATKLGQPEADVAYRWVRRGKWKLILPESPDAWGGYLSAPALFDVEADPHELDNLAGTKRGEKPLIELKEKLDQWWNPRETAARRTAQNIAAVCASASAAGLFFVAEAKGNFDRTLDLIVKGARVEDAGNPFDGTWFGTPQYTKEDLEAAKPYLRIEVGLLIYQP
ncbi:MAG: sulfatase-like hydrolase/transferase, partial [Verrucomicrobiota bacterium]